MMGEQGLQPWTCGFQWANDTETADAHEHRCIVLTNNPEHSDHVCSCGGRTFAKVVFMPDEEKPSRGSLRDLA